MTGPYIPGITPQLQQQGFTDQQKQAILKLVEDYLSNNVDSRMSFNLHRHSDADMQSQSIHHTLGKDRYDASPGPHAHDGSDSVALADGVVFSGALIASPTLASIGNVVKEIVTLLVTLGASDATT